MDELGLDRQAQGELMEAVKSGLTGAPLSPEMSWATPCPC